MSAGGMNVIGVNRYNKMPTRHKLQLMWLFVGGTFFVHQLLNLTVGRVQPKREEQMYTILKEQFPDGNIPPHILDQVQALREMKEALSLQTALATPTPGQFQIKLMNDMDHKRMGAMRRE